MLDKVLLLSLFDEWCLGLRSISAVLKANKIPVSLCILRGIEEMNHQEGKNDPNGFHLPPGSISSKTFDAFWQLFSKIKPDIVGISVYSNFYGLACHITSELRKKFNPFIVWGGVDVTANPDLAIKHADAICIGEGEYPMMELVLRRRERKKITDIANLWVKDNDKIHKNTIRPLIRDLDNLPYPDFEKGDKYYISGGEVKKDALPKNSHLHTNYPLLTARGCPNQCSYCCNSFYKELYGNNIVRQRSVENIIIEIQKYIDKNQHINFIEFHDDVFGLDIQWLEKFSNIYPEKIGLPFFCYSFVNSTNEQYVQLLKKSGVQLVAMGIQSGSQKILQHIYKRNMKPEKIIQAFTLFNNYQIPVVIDIIADSPFDEEEDYRDTFELLLNLPSGFRLHGINSLAFYRNYPITRMAEEKGIKLEPLLGRNAALWKPTKKARFWKALYNLTQFQEFPRDDLWKLSQDEYLKKNSEVIENLSGLFISLKYMPGTRVPYLDYIDKLQRELQELKSSPWKKVLNSYSLRVLKKIIKRCFKCKYS